MPSVELKKKLKGHSWQISCLSFHPTNQLLASGSWDRTVRLWDINNEYKEISTFSRDVHQAPILSLAWHPNGQLLATGGGDNLTCIWDTTTATCVKTLKEHFGWILGVDFAPDRTKLATASWDRTVRLWDPSSGELLSTLRGHTKGVWCCKFYPVGHTSALLATAGEDATCRLWDTRTRKVALTLSGGHVDAIYSMDWSNDGSLIATGSADKTVAIWDPKVGRVVKILQGHDDTVKSLQFMPGERSLTHILASAGGHSGILWHTKSSFNSILSEIKPHETGKEVEAVAISHDGKFLATGGRDGLVCVSSIPLFPGENERERAAGAQQKKGSAAANRTSVVSDELAKAQAKIQAQVVSRFTQQQQSAEDKTPQGAGADYTLASIAIAQQTEQPRHRPGLRPVEPEEPAQHPMIKIFRNDEASTTTIAKPPPQKKLTDDDFKKLMERVAEETKDDIVEATNWKPRPQPPAPVLTEQERLEQLMDPGQFSDKKVPVGLRSTNDD